MGNALRMIPEPELRQNCNRLTSRDLEDRLLASTPAIDNAVSRTVSLINATERQHLLQSAPIFRNLSSSERCEIGSLAGERRYSSRQVIVNEGDKRGDVLLIVSGRVKISQTSHTGGEVILRIRKAGDVVGGLGMSPREAHSSTIRAMEPCRALHWKAEDFDRLCSFSTTLHSNVVQDMNNMLRVLQDCFCELATLKVSSRLARTLLRLAEQHACEGQNVPIPLTCEELGQMAGTTLFTVSRLLCKWTEMGLLYSANRGIVIEDMVGLLEVADGSPLPANALPVA
ncbi:MAG: Crp/Fnr family transcriptional regulator [Acidobacteriia bacterium]|nr:Crp/Fnr family transcriptional regulator [Terriglobia bacterium]